MFVSPAVAGDAVYVGSCSGVYYAFDLATGEVRWSYDASRDAHPALFHGNPLVEGDLVITGTDGNEAGYMYAFDRATGEVRWKVAVGGVETDLVRTATAVVAGTTSGDLAAVDPASGAELWRFTPEGLTGLQRPTTPALAGDRLFYAAQGVLYALRADSGEIVWRRDLGSRVSTPVTWHGGALYAGVQERRLHRLDPASGGITATLELEDFPHHSLVPAGDLLLVLLGETRLAAVDLELAGIRWQQETPGEWITFFPHVVGDHVLAGNDAAELFAFRERDGALAWSSRFEGVPRGLGHQDGVAYVGTLSGPIYAFRMPDAGDFTVAAAPAASAPPPSCPTPAGEGTAVRRVIEGLIAADNAGNLDAVLAYYADDARLLPPGEEEVGGKTAIEARYRRLLAENRLELEVESHETIIAGDWAFDRGRTRGRVIPRFGGAARAIDDRYLMILRRGAEGGWRIARLAWQPLAAPAEARAARED